MKPDPVRPEPTPDQLAAYFDGELHGPARVAVETWLESHPDGSADPAERDRLERVWRQTQASEPAPATWEALRARLEAALPPKAAPPRRRPAAAAGRPAPFLRGPERWFGAAAAVAAAVLVALLIAQWFRPSPPAPTPATVPVVLPRVTDPGEQRAVAESADPQSLPELTWLAHDQVHLDDTPPEVAPLDHWGMPMIVDPALTRER